MLNKAFTVSAADAVHAAACDYVGLVSGRNEPRKMKKAGFTTVKSEFVNAPIINELPLTLECRLDKVLDELIVGRIVNVSADESILDADGTISLEKFVPIAYDTVHLKYYRLGDCVGKTFSIGKTLM